MMGTRWTLTDICCHPAQAGAESSVRVLMSSEQHGVCRRWVVEQERLERCLWSPASECEEANWYILSPIGCRGRSCLLWAGLV